MNVMGMVEVTDKNVGGKPIVFTHSFTPGKLFRLWLNQNSSSEQCCQIETSLYLHFDVQDNNVDGGGRKNVRPWQNKMKGNLKSSLSWKWKGRKGGHFPCPPLALLPLINCCCLFCRIFYSTYKKFPSSGQWQFYYRPTFQHCKIGRREIKVW